MQRQKNNTGHLILFTRVPRAGDTKTRLIPALGAEGAARLQRQMSEAALATLMAGAAATGATLEIRFRNGDEAAIRHWLPGATYYTTQGDGDLGQRLAHAIADACARGDQPVIVVGADCPALKPAHLVTALHALVDHDLVVGPATDGGYYLLGLTGPQPDLFTHMPWGTAHVLRETLARAQALGLTHLMLETLPDVDRPEDLIHLDHHPRPR